MMLFVFIGVFLKIALFFIWVYKVMRIKVIYMNIYDIAKTCE